MKSQRGSATIESAMISSFMIMIVAMASMVLVLSLTKSLAHHIAYETCICVLEGLAPKTCAQNTRKNFSKTNGLYKLINIEVKGRANRHAQTKIDFLVWGAKLSAIKHLSINEIKKAVRSYK